MKAQPAHGRGLRHLRTGSRTVAEDPLNPQERNVALTPRLLLELCSRGKAGRRAGGAREREGFRKGAAHESSCHFPAFCDWRVLKRSNWIYLAQFGRFSLQSGRVFGGFLAQVTQGFLPAPGSTMETSPGKGEPDSRPDTATCS